MIQRLTITIVILSLILVGTCYAAPSVVRGPYLQKANSNSIIIRWRTSEPTDSAVRYGTKAINKKISNKELTTEHRVEIKNLKPATRYFYTVGTKKKSLTKARNDIYFNTHPIIGSETKTRIWVIGDSGYPVPGQVQVLNGYYRFIANTKKRANLWLMLGDNAYPKGTDQEYQIGLFNTYKKLLQNTVLWPTYGNHDGLSANSHNLTGPYYDNFSLPRNAESGGLASNTEAYYSFDYGQIHFICLNSYDIDRSPNGQMATWLKNDLNSTKLRWKIAFWHHPPYSKSSHDSDTEKELIEMRENILPILEQGNTDLVLSGHSHAYERSMLLNGHYGSSSTLTANMILDNSPGENPPYHKTDKGTVYIVAGNGSLIQSGALNHPAIKASSNELGSLIIDVDKNTLTSQLIDSNGNALDRFSITK